MRRLGVMMAVMFFLSAALPAWGATVIVDGTSNTFLAGEVDGTVVKGDAAPTYSPVPVTGIPIRPGDRLRFTEADGSVRTITEGLFSGPDGSSRGGYSNSWQGLAGISAPWNALMGVFLDEQAPSAFSYWEAPYALDFWNEPRSRNFTTLWPAVRQPFFIGDGSVRFIADGSIVDGVSNTVLLGDGSVRPTPFNEITDGTSNTILVQEFVVPEGATRLYLGVMDYENWHTNEGSFTVDVSAVPLPSTMLLLGSGIAGLAAWRRRVR